MASSKKQALSDDPMPEKDTGQEFDHGLNVSPTMPYYCTWLPGACPVDAKAAEVTAPPFTIPPMCPPAGAGAATIIPTIVPPCPTGPVVCVPTLNPPCPKPDAQAEAARPHTATIITCTGIPVVCGAHAQAVPPPSSPQICCLTITPSCMPTFVCPAAGAQTITIIGCMPTTLVGAAQAQTYTAYWCPPNTVTTCPPAAVAQTMTMGPGCSRYIECPAAGAQTITIIGCMPTTFAGVAQAQTYTAYWCPPNTAVNCSPVPAVAQTTFIPPYTYHIVQCYPHGTVG